MFECLLTSIIFEILFLKTKVTQRFNVDFLFFGE